MKCAVCGGRSRTGIGFDAVFKVDPQGNRVAGKLIHVHRECHPKLPFDTKPASVEPTGRRMMKIMKRLAKRTSKEARP